MQETLAANRVSEIKFRAEPGLGFGEGSISRVNQLKNGELSEADEAKGLDYIQNSPEAFVSIDKQDDGCGDGRITEEVYRVEDGQKVSYDYSLNRAKVFGGGLMMANAALIGVGKIAQNSESQISIALQTLELSGVKFGAHTDTHAHGENCGCGAIDKYPTIVANAIKYRTPIRESLNVLLGADFSDDAYSSAADNYARALETTDISGYAGSQTKEIIENQGAVIKKLAGNHQEDFVVINFIEGSTLNQTGLMAATESGAQAFCVDAWRLPTYVDAVTSESSEKSAAMYGMLIYTLATSATLTDGSLRVLVRK